MAANPHHQRFVAGAMGPGTKFATLGNIRYAELRDHYWTQARGLIEGGSDLLVIETQFDLLGAKAAINGARRAMALADREVPLQVQVTIELTGRMLPGTEIGAALNALEAMRPDVLGINCATGPAEMGEHLRYLCQHARVPISCLPNAGLPSVKDGHMHYDLTAQELADYHARFITDYGVTVIGGCCGSTPEYIRLLVERCKGLTPAPRDPQSSSRAQRPSTAFSPSTRTPASSSSASGPTPTARRSSATQCWKATGTPPSPWPRSRSREGAHVLDVCVDYVARDGTDDMDQLAQRFCTQASVPLVLDSTEPQVMEAGLQWIGGRAILNSANLEDGEHEGLPPRPGVPSGSGVWRRGRSVC